MGLKALTAKAIPRALEKAERYRLLNQAWEAECIARDILAVEPDHQAALIVLLLALTDQFGASPRVPVAPAREILAALTSAYDQAYYAGVISERWAKAELAAGVPGYVVHQHLVDALDAYTRAERMQPDGTEDAVLRWNACQRMIERAGLAARDDDRAPELDDEVPTTSRSRPS